MLFIKFQVNAYGASFGGDIGEIGTLSIFNLMGGNEVRFRETVDLWLTNIF